MDIARRFSSWSAKVDQMGVRKVQQNILCERLLIVGGKTLAVHEEEFQNLFDKKPELITYNATDGMLTEKVGLGNAQIARDQLAKWDALKNRIVEEAQNPEHFFLRTYARLHQASDAEFRVEAEDMLQLIDCLVDQVVSDSRTGTFAARIDGGRVRPHTLHLREPLL